VRFILKKKFIILSVYAVLFLSPMNAWSAGIFSTGIGIGVSGDTGGLDSTVSFINSEMRKFQIANPGTGVTEIETLYSPVIALNFSYIYNYSIFKAGWEYSGNYFFKRSGSLGDNDIEISYSRFTFPVSAGILIPYDRKNRFYFAGGINYTYAEMRIKQSDPDPLWILPDEKYTFAGDILGFHVKAGGEVLLSRNYTFLFEVTRFFGKESKVDSEEDNARFPMRLNTFQFTAGINYTVDI